AQALRQDGAASAEPPASDRDPFEPSAPDRKPTHNGHLAADRATPLPPAARSNARGNPAAYEQPAPLPQRVPGASPGPRPSAPVEPPELPASLSRSRFRDA